jgi:hypothetical protein
LRGKTDVAVRRLLLGRLRLSLRLRRLLLGNGPAALVAVGPLLRPLITVAILMALVALMPTLSIPTLAIPALAFEALALRSLPLRNLAFLTVMLLTLAFLTVPLRALAIRLLLLTLPLIAAVVAALPLETLPVLALEILALLLTRTIEAAIALIAALSVVAVLLLLLRLEARVQHPVVMVGVLIVIFRRDPIAHGTCVARHGKEFFHELLRVAPRPHISPVEVGITEVGITTAGWTRLAAVPAALAALHVVGLVHQEREPSVSNAICPA